MTKLPNWTDVDRANANFQREQAIALALEVLEIKIFYNSTYRCDDCGQEWSSIWDSACDDECSGCGVAYSPYEYYECDEDGNEEII